jgi:DNA-binding CsgD family transcriptional regulator
MSRKVHIILAEPSPVVYEGLTGILSGGGFKCQFSPAGTLDEIMRIQNKSATDLVIMNPSLLYNNVRTFQGLKSHMPAVRWVGIIYACHTPDMLSHFDTFISVSDQAPTILRTISDLLRDDYRGSQPMSHEVLSERETEVLKLMAEGMANKEIAEKLHISINTVITHRKNISQKTGIRSLSGLTIYAVTQKIISI